MTTAATRSVAVVATRLPITDRRALSQAWFSALHLAALPHNAVPAAPRALPAACSRAASPQPRGAAGKPPQSSVAAAAPSRPSGASASGGPPVDRRAPVGDLARRIERAVARRADVVPPRAASIAIDAGEGRVALLVRTDGATTRIIALCAPKLRERVDRALAQARFSLAAGGTRVETGT
jgi:hypothetical protein